MGRLVRTVDRLRRKIQQAHAEADRRALIELAKGVLVEQLRCSPGHAGEQLISLAEQSGLSLLELAVDIINQSARDRVSELAQELLDPDDSLVGDQRSAAARLRAAESGAGAADDTQAVAQSLLDNALAPLGAVAVAIWAVGADASLTLAGYAGITAAEAARWRYVPPGVDTPARRALVQRDVVWLTSLVDSGLPTIGSREAAHGGRVVVPLDTGGRIVGVLEVGWPHPVAPQPPQIQRQIAALAHLCASTLDNQDEPVLDLPPTHTAPGPSLDNLVDLAEAIFDPALVLRPQMDANGRLADFRIHHTNSHFRDPAGRPRSAITGALLLEAYPTADGEHGLFDKIEHVHATGEPYRAERMTLTALVDQVPLAETADISISRHGDNVLVTWRIQDETVRLASLLQHAQRLGRIGGFEENTVTGEIIWNSQLFALCGLPPTASPIPLDQLASHANPDDADAIGRFLRTLLHHRRPASTAFRLQLPDGVDRHIRVIAEPVLSSDHRLLAVRGAYQDISAQHWTEVALAAIRHQLAQTEQQSAERNRLALQLQRAIMPAAPAPLNVDGLRIAVRYRPAETEHLVGGDWYDAVTLPSKQILLSVGDIAGHGIDAATGMVMLRNALRGLAATGAGPAQLLTWLNLVANHLTEHVIATAVCAVYDPQTRTLRWARAGHLPPILVRDQDTTSLPLIDGILLGALPTAEYQEAQLQLEAGDTLLLYTDGLIERKDRDLDDSLQHLLATAQHPATTLEQRLDHLLTHNDNDTDDDTCIVGVQLR